MPQEIQFLINLIKAAGIRRLFIYLITLQYSCPPFSSSGDNELIYFHFEIAFEEHRKIIAIIVHFLVTATQQEEENCKVKGFTAALLLPDTVPREPSHVCMFE